MVLHRKENGDFIDVRPILKTCEMVVMAMAYQDPDQFLPGLSDFFLQAMALVISRVDQKAFLPFDQEVGIAISPMEGEGQNLEIHAVIIRKKRGEPSLSCLEKLFLFFVERLLPAFRAEFVGLHLIGMIPLIAAGKVVFTSAFAAFEDHFVTFANRHLSHFLLFCLRSLS